MKIEATRIAPGMSLTFEYETSASRNFCLVKVAETTRHPYPETGLDARWIYVTTEGGEKLTFPADAKVGVFTEETGITDYDGNAVEVGTRVRMWDYEPGHPEYGDGNDPRYFGTVVFTSGWDGDVDDEGRSFGIAPRVHVRFDDGSEEAFTTEWTTRPYVYEYEDGKVEELRAVVEVAA